MHEIWKSVLGFEGLYEVSNLGRVKALERLVINNGGLQRKHERILKQHSSEKRRHCTVVLCKDGKTYPKLVHRLVATAFIPNPDGKPVVDHIDTNPFNNCVDNLRWVTVQENCNNPLTRQHGSDAKKGHPYWGRALTMAERAKIASAHRGRTLTEEHKDNLSKAHRNSKKAMEVSKQNIKKAQQANIGTHHSDETKEKIRAKLTGVHKGKSWKIVDGKRVWYERGF